MNNRTADGTVGRGIYVIGATSQVTFSHVNVEAKNSVFGVDLKNGSSFKFEGHTSEGTAPNIIKMNGNHNDSKSSGLGLYMTDGSKFETLYADIEANENIENGIYAGSGTTFSAEGSSLFENWLRASKNKNVAGTAGVGIYGNNSTINIKHMNVAANGNGFTGLSFENAAQVNIQGFADGSNKIFADGNKNTASSAGRGIYVGGGNAKLDIKYMDIFARGNVNGLVLSDSGKLFITGSSNKVNWLYAVGNRNASSTFGSGISSSGNGVELKITNMNVDVSDNVTGLSSEVSGASGSSSVKLEGNGTHKFIANNNIGGEKGRGISASATGTTADKSVVTVEKMDIEAKGNSYAGISSVNGIVNVIGNGSNKLLLENNGVAGLYSGKGAGSINISGMDVTSKNNIFARVLSGGSLKIEDSKVDLSNNTQSAFIVNNGIANINLKNVVFSNNKGRLLDVYEHNPTDNIAATLKAENSTLVGAVHTAEKTVLTGVKTNLDFKNVTWKNVGTSNVSTYKSDNTNVFMNVFFGTSKASDKLTITDNSSGASTLHIASTGTEGKQSSVLLVDQSSVANTNANGNFKLHGNVLDGGAFEYALFKGDEAGSTANANNWYLRSTGTATNTAKTLMNVPTIHMSMVKASLNELRKRLGEIRNGDYSKDSGVWTRTYAKSMKVNDNIDSKMNLFGFETGYDHVIYSSAENRVIAGLMAGYSYTDNIKTRNSRSINSSGHANTPTVGAYATWLNSQGWFADTTLRHFWSDMSMTTYTAQGDAILFENTRQYTAGTFEFGRQLKWDIDPTAQYVLEPKVEFSYAHAGAKNFRLKSSNFTGNLNYGATESFQTRVGVMTGYNKKLDNGSILQPFIEASVIREFSGITDINYAGADYKSDVRGTSYEVGVGLNAQLDDSWALYGDTMREFGPNVQGISANLGVRYSF